MTNSISFRKIPEEGFRIDEDWMLSLQTQPIFSVGDSDSNKAWHVLCDGELAGLIGFVEKNGISNLHFESAAPSFEMYAPRIKGLFYGLFCAERFLITEKDYLQISEYVELGLPRVMSVFTAEQDAVYVNGSVMFLCLMVVKRTMRRLKLQW